MKLGFIGCGGFIQGNHLPNAARDSRFTIRAICDVREEILDVLKKTYTPAYFTTDYHRVCSDPEIELVVIGTSPNLRYELIEAAARNGKNIFVEKPLATTVEEGRRIVDVVQECGVRLMVGMNRPYSDICRDAKAIYTRVKRGPALISYRIVAEDLLWPQHLRDKLDAGASTIVHEVVHIFDLLNWLTETDPLRIYCTGGRSDNNITAITYPDETEAVIVSGGCGTEGHTKERMEIFTDNKVIVMDEFVELQCTQIPNERDRRFPLKSHPAKDRRAISVPELREDLMEWRRNLSAEEIQTGYYYGSRPSVDKGHANELGIYHDLIRAGKPAITNETRGLMALIMAEAAIKSLATKQPVEIDQSLDPIRTIPIS